ncbi:MAG: hypothetical protein ABIS50_06505 [Luteolibacter sp.]|uniref:hypothetical protein n=1 Tax=Luteolibacter sp. TaxID=1962973 RepID=UPI0032631E81
MDAYDLDQLHHHDAALQTMVIADPDRAEDALREYFGAGSTAWTGWDEQFITFIEKRRKTGLLYGTIGDGWYFLFSPSSEEGFWVCLREGMAGKGFLRPESMASLTEVAIEKGLYERPRPEYG